MTFAEKKDSVMNAVLVGMLPEDAYIFAGLTAPEIEVLDKDEEFQDKIRQGNRILEHQLLNQMKMIADKQMRMGKEGATAWLLEKLYPRYSSKPQEASAPVTINLGQKDPIELDTVTITGVPSTVKNGVPDQIPASEKEV